MPDHDPYRLTGVPLFHEACTRVLDHWHPRDSGEARRLARVGLVTTERKAMNLIASYLSSLLVAPVIDFAVFL
jgi:hypothetical protein